jgi:hypothetical protein
MCARIRTPVTPLLRRHKLESRQSSDYPATITGHGRNFSAMN